jgi:hypothetical protein
MNMTSTSKIMTPYLDSVSINTDLRIYQILVTPEMASLFQSTMVGNQRNVNESRVSNYAREIRDEKWFLGDSIKFNNMGQCFDGGHRLAAIIKSGVATQMVVVTGYPPESMSIVDIGQKRTLVDIARIEGVEGFTNWHSPMLPWFYYNYAKTTGHPPAISQRRKLDLFIRYQKSFEFACSFGVWWGVTLSPGQSCYCPSTCTWCR